MPLGGDKKNKLLLQVLQSAMIFMHTVESHVLGEGLRQHNVVARLDEVPNSPGITINVAAGEALVGHVKEHQQVPFL